MTEKDTNGPTIENYLPGSSQSVNAEVGLTAFKNMAKDYQKGKLNREQLGTLTNQLLYGETSLASQELPEDLSRTMAEIADPLADAEDPYWEELDKKITELLTED